MKQPDGSDRRLARARRYFGEPGFARLLREIWRRYASLGRVGGTAVVSDPSAEELEAVHGFMGSYRRPGERLEVKLANFEQELRTSVFELTIPQLHELLTGSVLLTNAERRELLEQDWLAVFDEARAMLAAEDERYAELARWLNRLRDGQASAYRTLREAWKADRVLASRQLGWAIAAWRRLIDTDATRGEPCRLPVLAAAVAGDPHALDRTTAAGRLLFQALREWTGQDGTSARDEPTVTAEGSDIDTMQAQASAAAGTSASHAAEEQEAAQGIDSLAAREIYRQAGIRDDDISSLVHLCRPGEQPHVLTLREVEALEALPSAECLYVVENPAVFSSLADGTLGARKAAQPGESMLDEAPPLLVCTSGPASAAALRLFDRMADSGQLARLYYSGDYDVKGIAIGSVLAQRYPYLYAPWRFGQATYADACEALQTAGVAFTDAEHRRLLRMAAVWDSSLCPALAERGRKLFQEELLERLLADWLRAAGITGADGA